ncbi:unnamed protein product [Owenia fusiformis]|uniref:CRAL-TRIO domain-containing protein n=1 Tax=Owenia fusiformis TaxID=6347 RepID=A0A8S4N8J8_OWEFU|nr:unnamed protein product [Owenia fusiformis]
MASYTVPKETLNYEDFFPGFKALFEAEEYASTLTTDEVEKAKTELNEDPKERVAAVQQLRDWINKQPHFECCTDTLYLLSFLRRCKFSQLECHAMLERNVCTLPSEVPEWSCNTDTLTERFRNILKEGFLIPLPHRDDEGRRVVLMRYGQLRLADPNLYDWREYLRLISVMLTILQREEATQVNGLVFLLDDTGIKVQHLTFVPIQKIRTVSRIFFSNFPGRVKALHLYNAGDLVNAILTLLGPLMPQKIRDRIVIHKNKLEDVYKHIPQRILPLEYLPDDYEGPSAGYVDDIRDFFLRELTRKEVRDRLVFLSTEKMRYMPEKKDNGQQLEQTFRKLNVD